MLWPQLCQSTGALQCEKRLADQQVGICARSGYTNGIELREGKTYLKQRGMCAQVYEGVVDTLLLCFCDDWPDGGGAAVGGAGDGAADAGGAAQIQQPEAGKKRRGGQKKALIVNVQAASALPPTVQTV